jgi:GNAT superfamily N-acetyltransferase
MKKPYVYSINKKFVIKKLMPTDVNALLKAGFVYNNVLNQIFANRLNKMAGLVPDTTGFVIYNTQENLAVGYLSLIEYTTYLYSIKYVFVSPTCRRMGLATELLNYSMTYAKEHGAKKIYLNPDFNDNVLLNFYLKRGFNLIVDSSMLWGGQSTEKMYYEPNGKIVTVNDRPEKSNDTIFSLCKECMGTNWVNFFELSRNNIINGFSQEFKHFFIKDAFSFDSENSIALIFKRPFLNTSSVELYVSSDSVIPHVLNKLSTILSKKGIAWSKTTILNVNSSDTFNLLNQMEFSPFQARILGRCI